MTVQGGKWSKSGASPNFNAILFHVIIPFSICLRKEKSIHSYISEKMDLKMARRVLLLVCFILYGCAHEYISLFTQIHQNIYDELETKSSQSAV